MFPPRITLIPSGPEFWLKLDAISFASSYVAPPTTKIMTFEAGASGLFPLRIGNSYGASLPFRADSTTECSIGLCWSNTFCTSLNIDWKKCLPFAIKSLFENKSPFLIALPAYSIKQSTILTWLSARPYLLKASLIWNTFSSFSYLNAKRRARRSFSILEIFGLAIISSTYL